MWEKGHQKNEEQQQQQMRSSESVAVNEGKKTFDTPKDIISSRMKRRGKNDTKIKRNETRRLGWVKDNNDSKINRDWGKRSE